MKIPSTPDERRPKKSESFNNTASEIPHCARAAINESAFQIPERKEIAPDDENRSAVKVERSRSPSS
jgi:hypothetical protein